MNIVLDSNVVVAALLRDGRTRQLIVDAPFPLLLPEYVFRELREHEAELLAKSGLTRDAYKGILARLLKYVRVVPTERLAEFVAKAKLLAASIDPDDAPFFAACLASEPALLWSDDRRLKRQERILVLNTAEVKRLFEGAIGP